MHCTLYLYFLFSYVTIVCEITAVCYKSSLKFLVKRTVKLYKHAKFLKCFQGYGYEKHCKYASKKSIAD